MSKQVDSQRQKYLSSKPLNPQSKQELPLEAVNEQILEQASEVKRNFRNKLSAKRTGQSNKTPELERNQKKDLSGLQKYSRNNITSQTCTPLKLSREQKSRLRQSKARFYSIDDEEQDRRQLTEATNGLYGKITIHVLRSRKEKMEEDMKSYQSQFSYVNKKLQKLKRVKELSEKHCKKLEEIKMEKRRKSEELRNTLLENQAAIKHKNDELRQQVLKHRAKKETNLQRMMISKHKDASYQRQLNSYLKNERKKSEEKESNDKRIEFVKEKINEISRQKNLNRKAEECRMTAKMRFRNKWLDEFENNEKAKEEIEVKKQDYANKIRYAMNKINQFQIMQFYE